MVVGGVAVVVGVVVVGVAVVVADATVVVGVAGLVVVGAAFDVAGASVAAVSVVPPEQAETNKATTRNQAPPRLNSCLLINVAGVGHGQNCGRTSS